MEQLFESIKAGGNTFITSGQSMETFAAITGKMASKGKKGEEAGTALRNIMLRLSNPVGKAGELIENMNIKISDQSGNFRDIIDIIGDFQKETKKMGEVERAATLDTIFGKKAINAFNIILGEGSKSLREYREELKNSGGASKRMADIMRDSLGKRLAALKSAAIEVGFKFLDAFKNKGVGAIESITAKLRIFDVQPIITAVKNIGNTFVNMFNFIKPFFPDIKNAMKGVVEIGIELFPLLVGAVGKVVDVVKDLISSFSFLKPIITGITKSDVKVILGLAAAFKAVSVGIGLVNIVMAANPIGLIIAGVASLTAALVVLERKFDIIGRLDKAIIEAATSISDFFGFDTNKKPSVAAPNRKREVTPPNREDLLFRSRQQVDLSGRIDLAGAPEGTKFELFNAPQIKPSVLGANP
jgi:hypothetical protein